MTKNYKHLAFEGKVGRNAEMRYTPSGQAVTDFSVAVNDDYKDKSGQLIKRVAWIRVSAWGELAEICNTYVVKGMGVIVDGWLNPDKETGGPRVYEANGTWRSSYEITAQTVRFLSSKGEDSAPAAPQNTGAMLPPDDEIPF